MRSLAFLVNDTVHKCTLLKYCNSFKQSVLSSCNCAASCATQGKTAFSYTGKECKYQKTIGQKQTKIIGGDAFSVDIPQVSLSNTSMLAILQITLLAHRVYQRLDPDLFLELIVGSLITSLLEVLLWLVVFMTY